MKSIRTSFNGFLLDEWNDFFKKNNLDKKDIKKERVAGAEVFLLRE